MSVKDFKVLQSSFFPPYLVTEVVLLVRAMYFDSRNAKTLKKKKAETKLAFRNSATHLKQNFFSEKKIAFNQYMGTL